MPLVIQTTVIDVTEWPEDPEHSTYPEGAREKSALFPAEPLVHEFLKEGRRYLFKLSDPRYPEQFWAETIAYVVGSMLGVQVPPAYIAFHSGRNACGALIEWFFVDGEQSFIAGGNRLQRILPQYDRKKGTDHSFHLVQRVCHQATRGGALKEDWLLYWGRAFLFDALIGNTDRHQDNWGFLSWTTDDGQVEECLAPLFDNGTSLGMERHLEHIATWDDNKYQAYLNKGRHHMKLLNEDTQRCQLEELVAHVVNEHPRLKPILKNMLDEFSLDEFRLRLAELCRLELAVRLSEERASFVLRLVTLRYERLCTILS